MDISCALGVDSYYYSQNEMYVEYQGSTFMDDSYDDTTCTDIKQRRSMEMLNLRAYVSKIRELVILSLSLSLIYTHTELLGFLI